jgi:hypothetical protein
VSATGPARANCGPQSGASCERQSRTGREPHHQQCCHNDDDPDFGAGQDQASRFLEDGLIQDDAKYRGDRRPRQNCLNAAKHVCGAPPMAGHCIGTLPEAAAVALIHDLRRAPELRE